MNSRSTSNFRNPGQASGKRRRIADEDDSRASTVKEIHSWTFSAEAVAPCTVKDVFEFRPNEDEAYDFFWLKNVPCRSVKIVGVVIGVQIYEKKTIYTIDDGTEVIDCYHPHSAHASPIKPKALAKYQQPVETKSVLPPKPIARIGSTVRLVGSVRNKHDSRIIHVTTLIEACRSPNDELLHWRKVRFLHEHKYSLDRPFRVPHPAVPGPSTPMKAPVPVKQQRDDSGTPSSTSTSPQKSSPVKDLGAFLKSLPKLRHPSRIHTHDLTENTFRIYLKHYMDHAPLLSSSDDHDAHIEASIRALPTTPTKRSRSSVEETETPRPIRYRPGPDSTPKAGATRLARTLSSSSTIDPQLQGFTLSYLRRVPELSLLATRVIYAVLKRRQREERRRLKEAGVIPSSSSSKAKPSSCTLPPLDLSADKLASKMKRLFHWAVIQLLKEGCIVLWDGPTRRSPNVTTNSSIVETSRLWKTVSPGSSVVADSTIFSSKSDITSNITSTSLTSEDVSGYLSDPEPNEEAYIPLSPAYLSPYVLKAIKVLVDHYEEIGKPYNGATKEGILAVLRKDDRWKFVGDWSVDDALAVLKNEGKAWNIKPGRWELTE